MILDAPAIPGTAYRRFPTNSHVVAIFVTFCLVIAALLALMLGSGSSKWLLISTALTICAVVTIPLMMRKSRLISSWFIFVVTVYMTVGLRTIYMVIGYPDDQVIQDLFTLGKPLDTFLTPSIWLAVFLFLLSCSYAVAQRVSGPSVKFGLHHDNLSSREENVLVVSLAILGLIGLIMFVGKSGGLEILSGKRNLIAIADIGIDTNYQSYGHWRYLQRSSTVALILYLVTKGRTPFKKNQWMSIVLLYALSISLPIYNNSRTQVVFITVALVGYLSMRHGAIALKGILVGSLGVLLLFQILTSFRVEPGISETMLIDEIATSNPIDTVVLTRNLVSLPRNAHTWHALENDLLQLKYGSTMVSWVYGWVPRVFWPSKPAVQSGAELGPVIYGDKVGGAPPGLAAESFWNFGLYGGLLVAPLSGLALGAVDTMLRPRGRSGSELQLGIYLLGVLPLATRIIGDSVSQGLIDAGADIVIAAGALMAVSVVRGLNRTETT